MCQLAHSNWYMVTPMNLLELRVRYALSNILTSGRQNRNRLGLKLVSETKEKLFLAISFSQSATLCDVSYLNFPKYGYNQVEVTGYPFYKMAKTLDTYIIF